jgi:hypothetical protein
MLNLTRSKLIAIASALFVLLGCISLAVTSADAQTRRKHASEPKQVDHPMPAASVDKRDSVVTAPGAFTGRAYWIGLAQCGGIYFKLNTFYADIAAHARAVKPDPKLTAEYTKKLNDAIKTATVFFNGAEHLLMNDRGLERVDAVLIYDEQSLGAGNRIKSIETALTAAKACPALYQACQEAYPKACSETLAPMS